MSDAAALEALQRSVVALTEKVEHMAEDLVTVKVNLALMTGKFLGGWKVIVAIGGIAAAVFTWLISLRVVKGIP